MPSRPFFTFVANFLDDDAKFFKRGFELIKTTCY